jgi:hypothetical protein
MEGLNAEMNNPKQLLNALAMSEEALSQRRRSLLHHSG